MDVLLRKDIVAISIFLRGFTKWYKTLNIFKDIETFDVNKIYSSIYTDLCLNFGHSLNKNVLWLHSLLISLFPLYYFISWFPSIYKPLLFQAYLLFSLEHSFSEYWTKISILCVIYSLFLSWKKQNKIAFSCLSSQPPCPNLHVYIPVHMPILFNLLHVNG